MKKLIIIVIIVIFLAGCGETPLKSEEANNNKLEDNIISIIRPRFSSVIYNDDFVRDWERYMEDKYHVNLNLIDVERKNNENGWNIDTDYLLKNQIEGLIYVESFSDLNHLINSGVIVPINEYLQNIESFDNTSEELLKLYSDEVDNIWALPLIETVNLSKRYYNSDWLEKANMEIPGNIEDFLTYAQFVANEDPDGNDKKDSYVLDLNSNSFIKDTIDILRAFGCYPGTQGTIGYNPYKQKFEDIVFTKEFAEALTYLKVLYDAGCISYNNTIQKDQLASYYGNEERSDYFDSNQYGYYLLGTNETNLIRIQGKRYGLAVLKYTYNASSLINGFLDMVYSNEESWMDLRFGRQNIEYFQHSDHYTAEVIIEDRKIISNQIGIKNELNRGEKDIVILKPKNASMPSNISNEKSSDILGVDQINTLFNSEMLFSVPFYIDGIQEDEFGVGTNIALQELLNGVFLFNESIEDAIANYKVGVSR